MCECDVCGALVENVQRCLIVNHQDEFEPVNSCPECSNNGNLMELILRVSIGESIKDSSNE